MSVNVSAIQLLCEDFIETVIKIVEDTGIPPYLLELEITESVILENFELINNKLKQLKSHGIEIALDDFGTGYSSFMRFNELNIDTVKIDRYFISKITNGKKGENIVGAIIAMAQNKGLVVVAEGVEDTGQKQYLIDQNCDIMQGFLFSRPVRKEQALGMIENFE
jgi:EAL domain-containing protein (putative c-di-GMP-specific phosphodiesterase class I)